MKAAMTLLALLATSLAVAGQPDAPAAPGNSPAGGGFEINWHKIAAGGTLASHGGPWTLGGTIGQHDDTAAGELESGPWSLTGGFWAPGYQLSDAGFIFRDRFED